MSRTTMVADDYERRVRPLLRRTFDISEYSSTNRHDLVVSLITNIAEGETSPDFMNASEQHVGTPLIPPLGVHEAAASADPNFAADGAQERVVHATLRGVLNIARNEDFVVGESSNLSVGLTTLCRRFPIITLSAIRDALREKHPDAIVAEVLRTLGRTCPANTSELCVHVIGPYLQHQAAELRDAAVVALSELDDVRARPYLESAIERERIGSLREDMHQSLEYLPT